MRWTGWVAFAAASLTLGGCVYGYAPLYQARYSVSSRPHPSYYCYDCHGYRYFDPYYDYCEGRGFRYRWTEHPRVIAIYRERYVRIRENHPDYGRHRYAPDYRSSSRYREDRGYDERREGRGEGRNDRDGRRRKPRYEDPDDRKRDDGDQDGRKEKRPGKPDRRKHDDDSRETGRKRGHGGRVASLAGR